MKSYHFLQIAGLLLIAVTASFISCQKEQLLVKKIEGTYKIEKIIYNTTHGDSVVSTPNSIMFFDYCVMKEQKGGQQCDGYIQIEGQERVSFAYRPEKDGNKISMFLNIGNPDHLTRYGGRYIAEERSRHTLTLVRYKYDEYLEKEINLQIFLKK